MVEILLRRTVGGAAAENADGQAVLARFPIGMLFPADVSDPRRRSGQYHRFFFALINKVWENQTYYKTAEHLRKALLIRLGHCANYSYKNGQPIYIADSMSFTKMTTVEAERFMSEAIKFLCEEVIPGLEPNALRREIEEMIGGPSVVVDAGGEKLTGLEGGLTGSGRAGCLPPRTPVMPGRALRGAAGELERRS